MGLLKKIKKSVKKIAKATTRVGAAVLTAGASEIPGVKNAMGNIADKGLGAFTIGQISGADRAKLLADRAATEQAAADKTAAEQAAADEIKAKAAAEEAARYKGQVSVGVQAADTAGVSAAGSIADPAVLAAQAEERKKKMLLAQQASRPRTILG